MKRRSFRVFLCLLCVLTLGKPAWAAAENEGGDAPKVYTRITDYAVVISEGKLNMRAGPSTEYDWVASAEPGEWVGILGESGDWYYAYLPSAGQYGYVAKSYIKTTNRTGEPAKAVVRMTRPGENALLRDAPSYQGNVIARYENGTPFEIITAIPDGWYEIENGDEIGYLRCENALILRAAGAALAELQAPDQGWITLRDRPFFSKATVVDSYPSGTQAEVLLVPSNISSFWKVAVNGRIGYVDGRFVKYTGVPYETLHPKTLGNAIVYGLREDQAAPMRKQPSIRSAAVGVYENADTLQLVNVGEAWCQVYDREKDCLGFIQTQYLILPENGISFIRRINQENTMLYTRNENGLFNQKILLPLGAELTVLSTDGMWTLVRIGGVEGEVRSDSLQ